MLFRSQTRNLTFDLSSATLYAIGLEAAVEELAEDFAQEYGFKLYFRSDQLPKELTESVKILLYRTVRELLINIAKHSSARNVYIDIKKLRKDLKIVVKDDGIGFDAVKSEDIKGKLKGFGLFSLRERLANINGIISIKSESGAGTTIQLTVPLKEIEGEL